MVRCDSVLCTPICYGHFSPVQMSTGFRWSRRLTATTRSPLWKTLASGPMERTTYDYSTNTRLYLYSTLPILDSANTRLYQYSTLPILDSTNTRTSFLIFLATDKVSILFASFIVNQTINHREFFCNFRTSVFPAVTRMSRHGTFIWDKLAWRSSLCCSSRTTSDPSRRNFTLDTFTMYLPLIICLEFFNNWSNWFPITYFIRNWDDTQVILLSASTRIAQLRGSVSYAHTRESSEKKSFKHTRA